MVNSDLAVSGFVIDSKIDLCVLGEIADARAGARKI